MSCGQALAAAVVLASSLALALPVARPSPGPLANQLVESAPASSFETFLDRLMGAESGGRTHAKNPRSTALGPFQFIKSTFLDVTRRYFPGEIAGLTEGQILSLRTDPNLSRRAAAVFCLESLSYLLEQRLEPTFAHLRLAYLLGPVAAARILQAPQETPVAQMLSSAVINANPFMRGMSVADLVAKSERDVSRDRIEPVAQISQPIVHVPIRPAVARSRQTTRAGRAKACNTRLTSCRILFGPSKRSRMAIAEPKSEGGRRG